MTNRKKTLRKVTETLGAASIILWFLVLGPVGLLAGLGLCYSMMVQNAALGLVCGIVLGSPLVMILAWGLFAWRAIVREERAETPARVSPGTTVHTAQRISA